jgi:hypothetical protein
MVVGQLAASALASNVMAEERQIAARPVIEVVRHL